MAAFRYEQTASWRITIDLDGPIEAGDSDRLEQVAHTCRQKQATEPRPDVVVAFNSEGGDYLEGLTLGRMLHRNGFGSWVRAGAHCYSAAAFAFLGGSFLGAVGGWGPDRHVEVGATVGFHSFHHRALDKIHTSVGIERGKHLAMILADYATSLRIDMNFIVESLKHGPQEFLTLRTVKHFRDLEIAVHGYPRTTKLTPRGAVIAANYATHWRRPVSLKPVEGETLAVVNSLTTSDYRKRILTHMTREEYHRGPVTELIRGVLTHGRPAELQALYDDAHRLNSVPPSPVGESEKVMHVSGFDYGGGFYVSDCYVIPSNDGTPELGLRVVKVQHLSFFDTVDYRHSGDVLFETHTPDTLLWGS